jgi:mannose-6-phosphate isomerase-like protein (cupin superfamily)/rubrerythrin
MKGMSKMYQVPNIYPNPYYVHAAAPMYDSAFMSRNVQREYQQVVDAIFAGIKREASSVDFYSRLAKSAPNQKHQNDILHVLRNEKVQLKHLTDLYTAFTGTQPVYEIDKVAFGSYKQGLQKAYELEIENYQEYRQSGLLTQHPLVRDVFLHACTCEKEHAERFGSLYGEVSNGLKDYGGEPFVVDIEKVTKQNETYRTALWTGDHLQVTVMSIGVGEDIGLEIHPALDQFIRVEQGEGIVRMGNRKDDVDFEERVYDDYAIMIPAGKWHNLINTGDVPIKLYSIYAPPEHPYGTVHETKADAMAAEDSNSY